MQLAKYPSVSWRVLSITIREKFRGAVFLPGILEHSETSLKLLELFPHYHLYPVCEEGGIHSIKLGTIICEIGL